MHNVELLLKSGKKDIAVHASNSRLEVIVLFSQQTIKVRRLGANVYAFVAARQPEHQLMSRQYILYHSWHPGRHSYSVDLKNSHGHNGYKLG